MQYFILLMEYLYSIHPLINPSALMEYSSEDSGWEIKCLSCAHTEVPEPYLAPVLMRAFGHEDSGGCRGRKGNTCKLRRDLRRKATFQPTIINFTSPQP